MSKLIIDTTDVDVDDVSCLKQYLRNERWDWEEEIDSTNYANTEEEDDE